MTPPKSTDPPPREPDVLRRALEVVRRRLPRGWDAAIAEGGPADGKADAEVRLSAPEGSSATLVLEAKRTLEARDLALVTDRLANTIAILRSERRTDGGAVAPMVVARYLSPRTRERLEELETNYADATGNLSLSLERPALFLRDVGAERDPWRGPGRRRDSYRGAPAGRTVRALVDFAPPVTVPELAERSGTSIGATYRMVELLESDAYIQREPRKAITRVEWRRMLERWSQDCEFAASNSAGAFLEPRSLTAVQSKLVGTGIRYAITGSSAAHRYAPYASSRLAMIYVEDIDAIAGELDLRVVDGGSNVLLAEPKDDFVYDRSEVVDGLSFAAPSQVAADLLTSPGRGPSEGEALLDWMERNEPAWRR